MTLGVGLAQEVDLFLRKIQRGLNQHAQMHQGVAQGVNFARKLAGQGPAGAAGGGFRAGINQVSHRLGLGQIHLVVQESALGEFAGARNANARQPRRTRGRIACQTRFNAARQQQLQHHRPAMGLQFQHVFTRVGFWGREMDRQPLVDDAAIGGPKCQKCGFAGFQGTATEGGNQGRNCRARGAHHADRAAPRRSGNGNNWVIFAPQHIDWPPALVQNT